MGRRRVCQENEGKCRNMPDSNISSSEFKRGNALIACSLLKFR